MVGNVRMENRSLRTEYESSLTALAADESESYCLDDGGGR